MALTTARRTIARPTEEGPCCMCGGPLYVGDRVVDVLSGGDLALVCCSSRCAEHAKTEIREADRYAPIYAADW